MLKGYKTQEKNDRSHVRSLVRQNHEGRLVINTKILMTTKVNYVLNNMKQVGT